MLIVKYKRDLNVIYFPERMIGALKLPNPGNSIVKFLSNEEFDEHFVILPTQRKLKPKFYLVDVPLINSKIPNMIIKTIPTRYGAIYLYMNSTSPK